MIQSQNGTNTHYHCLFLESASTNIVKIHTLTSLSIEVNDKDLQINTANDFYHLLNHNLLLPALLIQ